MGSPTLTTSRPRRKKMSSVKVVDILTVCKVFQDKLFIQAFWDLLTSCLNCGSDRVHVDVVPIRQESEVARVELSVGRSTILSFKFAGGSDCNDGRKSKGFHIWNCRNGFCFNSPC